MYGLVSCDGCDGCGWVTNDNQRIPWTWHTRELHDTDGNQIFDTTDKVQCVKCDGKGRIPKHKLTPLNKKKYPRQGMGGLGFGPT